MSALSHRVYASVCGISRPLDAGRLVELKLQIDRDAPMQGEMLLRVPVDRAAEFAIGDCFSFRLVKVD